MYLHTDLCKGHTRFGTSVMHMMVRAMVDSDVYIFLARQDEEATISIEYVMEAAALEHGGTYGTTNSCPNIRGVNPILFSEKSAFS